MDYSSKEVSLKAYFTSKFRDVYSRVFSWVASRINFGALPAFSA
jgi:hypothetical protein